MGVADREGAGPRHVLTGIVVGLLLASCMIGWGSAASVIQPVYNQPVNRNLPIPDIIVVTTTPASQGMSVVACGQGCQCLMASEAQAQFGAGGYSQCSQYACGVKSGGNNDLTINVPMYCYRAQRIVSYVACGAGCTCLTDAEAQARFGGNYVKCSDYACGQGYYCFRSGQTSSVPPVQQQVPAVTTGSLSVSSTPSGAAVSVDALYKGTTPVTVSGLGPGYHTLKLSRAGYQDATRSALVDAGEVTGMSISLVPLVVPAVYRGSGSHVLVEPLADEVQAVKLADDAVPLNPQPELPKPDEYPVLNSRTEPSKTAPGGFFDMVISYFTGLFGGNRQNTSQNTPRADGSTFPPLHLPWDTPCSGTGAERCSGRCASTQSDPDNCGACGNKCNPEQICSGGTCSSLYPAGMKPGGGKSIAVSAAMPSTAAHLVALDTCSKCHDTHGTGSGTGNAAGVPWVVQDDTASGDLVVSKAMPSTAAHLVALNTCSKCHDTHGTGSGTGNATAVPWVIRDRTASGDIVVSKAMPFTAEHVGVLDTCSKCHDAGSGNANAPAIQWVGKDSTPPSEMSPSGVMPETAEHIIAFQTCSRCHATGSGNTNATAIQWVAKGRT